MSALLAGVAKFLKPPVIYLAIGAVVVIGAYQTGVNAERNRGEAAALRQELETIKSDQRLADLARESEKVKAAELEAYSLTLEEELNAVRNALAARPAGAGHPGTADDFDLIYGRPQ